MNGFSLLMFIFSVLVFIAGVVLITGHKDELLLWKVHNVKALPKRDVRNIGKWTIITSIIIMALSWLIYLLDF